MDKPSLVAIIGGTGLSDFAQGETIGSQDTPYGLSSSQVILANAGEKDFVFLSRHGQPHSIAPHRVNYRANLWVLKAAGVSQVVAVNAVGGINPDMATGAMVVPSQLIDYTYGREHTFFDGIDKPLEHIDFGEPYSAVLNSRLVQAANACQLTLCEGGTYGVTQGPRLETAAEIDRLERDGCDIVGMTAMPEAALARELGIDYSSLCLIVNPAAGRSQEAITMEQIHAVLEEGMGDIRRLLLYFLSHLS